MPTLLNLFGRTATAVIEAPLTLVPAAAVAHAVPSAEGDMAPVLDCLGAVLQCWSQQPILLPDESRADAERTIAEWQRHATLGTPISGVHAPDKMAGPVQQRDWTALTALTSARRRAEALNVGQHMGELQRVVWETVSSLARFAGDDVAVNRAVEQQIDLLRGCARRGDAAAIIREMPAVLEAITAALTERHTRATRERTAMAARVESLGRALTEAEDSARTDPMTGAGNRLRFSEAVERALALMTLSGAPASLITVDLDDLKGINDTLGHPAGDIAITAVAKACWTVCTRATDVVCRVGGDEFAVVMTNTNAAAAAALADRLEQHMQETPVTLTDGVARPVTASIGFAAAQPGEPVEAWIARADKRLYEAKRNRAA